MKTNAANVGRNSFPPEVVLAALMVATTGAGKGSVQPIEILIEH
jgi:hypothetical protein